MDGLRPRGDLCERPTRERPGRGWQCCPWTGQWTAAWSKLTVSGHTCGGPGPGGRQGSGPSSSDLTELKQNLPSSHLKTGGGRAVSTVTSIPGAKDGSCRLSRWSGAQGGFSPASPPVWPEEGKARVLNTELDKERCSAEERSGFQQLTRKRSSPHGPQACGKMSSPRGQQR